MRRFAALAAIAALLSLVLVGVEVAGRPGIAHATACYSSVTCQPANIPMLVEAGILTRSGAATTTGTIGRLATATPKAAGGVDKIGQFIRGLVSTVTGVAITQTYEDPDDGQLLEAGPVLGTNGVAEQTIEVEPWVGAAPAGWNFDPAWVVTQGSYSSQLSYSASISGGTGTITLMYTPLGTLTAGGVDIPISTATMMCADSLTSTVKYAATIREGLFASAPPRPRIAQTPAFTVTGTATCPVEHPVAVEVQTGSRPNPLGSNVTVEPSGDDFKYGVYLAPGVPGRSEGPVATIERTLYCADALGAILKLIDSQAVMAGEPYVLDTFSCDPDTAAVDYSMTIETDEAQGLQTVIPRRTIEAEPLPPDLQEIIEHPDCWDGSCRLTLTMTTGETCGLTAELCPDWATEETAQPGQYKCTFGGREMPIEACSAYRLPAHGVLPNVDADGEYLPITAPAPATPGQSTTAPGGDPAPAPGAAGQPEAGQEGGECFPTGWGVFNPLSWILQPVKCALEWAFVPRQDKINEWVNRIKRSWDATSIAKVAASIGSIVTTNTGGSGCQGPPLHFEAFGVDQTYYPMNACDEPVAGAAATVKGLGAFLIYAGGLLAIMRYLAHIIGYAGFGQGDPHGWGRGNVRFTESSGD